MLNKISSVWAKIILIIFLGSAFGLMLTASRAETPIMDELAHIPAGYSYMRYFDYRLNPEHPPILKALATVPLLFLNLNFPTASPAWTTEINGQWDAGYLFLYASGNNPDQIVQLARIFPMLLTLLLIIFTYIWASKILGKWWGLIPAFLLSFSPTVLAHGHFVTTDIGAAFGILISLLSMVWFLQKPSWKSILVAGISFGIAQGLKFSAVLLGPYLIFLVLVWLVTEIKKHGLGFKDAWNLVWRYTGRLLLIFLIGYVLIIYPVYFAFTANYPVDRQVRDTQFTLTSFASGPTPAGKLCSPTRCLAEIDIWMAGNKVLRPWGQYFLGVLMVLQRASGGNTSYFLGKVSAAGSSLYFPLVYVLKETLAGLILIILGLFLGLWRFFKKAFHGNRWASWQEYFSSHLSQFTMLGFIILYWAYSIKSPLNIGVRHLMPVIPLTYILVVSSLKRWVMPGTKNAGTDLLQSTKIWFENQAKSLMKLPVILILLLGVLLSCLMSYPYFLSYFNSLGGGTYGGYTIVTDSNYDWGQDLLRLKDFTDSHPEIDKIAVDYFGGGDTNYYLGNKVVNWSGSMGDPRTQGIHWLAISINNLQNSLEPLAPGQGRDGTPYSWLQQVKTTPPGTGQVPTPDYRVGTSIFVYKLP